MRSVSASSSRSTWSRVASRSPALASRTSQARPALPVPRHRGRIERVDRLAELDHDVVRGVDDVADRPDAGGEQAHLDRSPATAATVDALDPPADEPRAQPLVLDRDGQPIVDRRRPPPRRRSAAARPGRRSTAATSRAMPTIDSASPRFGLTSTSSTTSPYRSARRAPSGVVGREDQDPVGVGREPELVARAEHPVRDDAHLLGPLDPATARQDGARERDRHALPDRDVRRAADDLERLARRRSSRASATAGPRAGASRPRAARRRRRSTSRSPRRSMPLTSMPEQRQPLGELLRA